MAGVKRSEFIIVKIFREYNLSNRNNRWSRIQVGESKMNEAGPDVET